ncbi:MaoC family dehydratase [Gordonia soli]|nr:MaoC family dehydratase [Gordonia soli]
MGTEKRTFAGVDELKAAVGEDLGSGDWLEITQERVNQFAEATGDHQWIHVDPERAADGPFGGPIAHGYLTLSLLPFLGGGIYGLDGVKLGINYGLNKVRFPQAVLVGSRIRATAHLVSADDTSTGLSVVVRFTVEIEGQAKPACVAENVVVYVL